MARGIRQVELLRGSGVTADVKKYTAYAIRGVDHGLVDGAGFYGMLVGHLKGVVREFVKGIWPSANGPLVRQAYLFIADVDAGIEAGEVDIDPVWIFGDRIEKAAVLDDIGVDGIVEAERIVRPVKCLVYMGWKIDPEIASSFWGVVTIAGNQAGECQQQGIRTG
jgi:hypothetical protein